MKYKPHSFGTPLPLANYDNGEDEEPEVSPEDQQRILDRFDIEFHGGKPGPKIKELKGYDLDEHLRKMYRRHLTG